METRELLAQAGDKSGLFQLDEKQNKKLKEILLDMCQDIFDFCKEHDLQVVLGGGSALGAARHKGFIPWDDDIDLNMPRADYDRFMSEFELEFGDKYEVFVPDEQHRMTQLFAKVSLRGTLMEDIYTAGDPVKLGVAVDIFPIEDVPANRFHARLRGFFSDAFLYMAVSTRIYQHRSVEMKSVYAGSSKGRRLYYLRCILGFLLSFHKYQYWYVKYNNFSRKQFDSELCTVPTGRKHYMGELTHKSEVFPTVEVPFENRTFRVVADNDAYMKRMYGDYMKLPPEDKRETHYYTKVDLGLYGE